LVKVLLKAKSSMPSCCVSVLSVGGMYVGGIREEKKKDVGCDKVYIHLVLLFWSGDSTFKFGKLIIRPKIAVHFIIHGP
jgi:hypothetical protein